MTTNAYQTGRLDLPFVGHCTFAKSPVCLDWNAIDADVAVIGVPNDMGTQWRPGARFGPRAIREASTLFSFGHGGAYDHEDDVMYLTREQARIVDVGDADIVHTDMVKSHANTEYAIRKILAAGAMPLVLGELPFAVQWLDSRDAIFPVELPPNVVCEQSEPVQSAVAHLPARVRVLIMSFSHAEDLDIVAACLLRQRAQADLRFIGLIGSQTKWATFRKRLQARGFSDAELAQVTSPIGVPGIPGKAPEVIAVAVAAQLLQLGD